MNDEVFILRDKIIKLSEDLERGATEIKQLRSLIRLLFHFDGEYVTYEHEGEILRGALENKLIKVLEAK